jgi:hypothetical protein
VRRVRGAFAIDASQAKKVRQTKFASARPAPLRHLQKPERLKLSDCRAYGVAMNAVFHEMLVSHRQLAVVVSAVMRKLNHNPIKNTPRGQAQHAVGWAFHHLD